MQGKNYEAIGQECGVTLKTIYRDMQAWTQTSDFDEWLDAEWVRLKTKAEQDDFMEVFRQLTKLKAKRITQKIESETRIEGGEKPIVVKMWKPQEENKE